MEPLSKYSCRTKLLMVDVLLIPCNIDGIRLCDSLSSRGHCTNRITVRDVCGELRCRSSLSLHGNGHRDCNYTGHWPCHALSVL
jgi:hypothetical protein